MSTPGAGAPGPRERLARTSVPLLAMLDRIPRFVVTGVLEAMDLAVDAEATSRLRAEMRTHDE